VPFVIVTLQPRISSLSCKIFLRDSNARLAEALLCKIVRKIRQDLAGSCSCELRAIRFDFSLRSVVSEKGIQLIRLTSLTRFVMVMLFVVVQVLGLESQAERKQFAVGQGEEDIEKVSIR